MRETLIAEYHQTLARDQRPDVRVLRASQKYDAERRLLYGDREISVALRPHLLNRTQYEILAHSSKFSPEPSKKSPWRCCEPSRMQTIGLTEREIKLALVEPKYSTLAVTSRLDAFVHDHEVRSLEYNAENPPVLPIKLVSTKFFSK